MRDRDDLLEWRNEETARKASFNTEPIKYEVHKEWFERSLANDDRTIYIGENDSGKKAGMIRVDKINDNTVELNINIAPSERGKGIGSVMIQKICDMHPFKCSLYIARARSENTASIKVFKKSGFFNIFEYEDKKIGLITLMGKIINA